MHRALWAVLLIGSAPFTAAQDQRGCKAEVIPDAKLREIAIAERNKAARSVSKANWAFEISREGCAYRVFGKRSESAWVPIFRCYR